MWKSDFLLTHTHTYSFSHPQFICSFSPSSHYNLISSKLFAYVMYSQSKWNFWYKKHPSPCATFSLDEYVIGFAFAIKIIHYIIHILWIKKQRRKLKINWLVQEKPSKMVRVPKIYAHFHLSTIFSLCRTFHTQPDWFSFVCSLSGDTLLCIYSL